MKAWLSLSIMALVLMACGSTLTSSGPSFSLHGTWVLQQANSVADADSATVENALATPGVKGYSVRVPWKDLEGSTAILDAAYQAASKHGLALAIRFMAGINTPASVFAAGSPFYLTNGQKAPSPFYPNGQPNTVFEGAYNSEVQSLASWARAHGVHELHLSWYGRLYAQYDDGAEVQAVPGYSYSGWLTAHERLAAIGWKYAGPDLSVELPVDGNTGGHNTVGDLTKYTDSLAAAHPNWLYQQTNGLGVYNAPPNGTVPHGQQMYNGNDYDWNAIYGLVRQNQDVYVEVYASSFAASLPHHSELVAQIQAFK